MEEENITELIWGQMDTLFQSLLLWLKVGRPWTKTTWKRKDNKCSEQRTSIAKTMKIQETNKNDFSIDKNMQNSWYESQEVLKVRWIWSLSVCTRQVDRHTNDDHHEHTCSEIRSATSLNDNVINEYETFGKLHLTSYQWRSTEVSSKEESIAQDSARRLYVRGWFVCHIWAFSMQKLAIQSTIRLFDGRNFRSVEKLWVWLEFDWISSSLTLTKREYYYVNLTWSSQRWL